MRYFMIFPSFDDSYVCFGRFYESNLKVLIWWFNTCEMTVLQPLGQCGVECTLCNSSQIGCAQRIAPLCKWCKEPIIERPRCMNSIVTCYHSMKLCTLATPAFWSQENSAVTSRSQPGLGNWATPWNFSITCLVVWYSNKLQLFWSQNISWLWWPDMKVMPSAMLNVQITMNGMCVKNSTHM